jgi:hypothetical protein
MRRPWLRSARSSSASSSSPPVPTPPPVPPVSSTTPPRPLAPPTHRPACRRWPDSARCSSMERRTRPGDTSPRRWPATRASRSRSRGRSSWLTGSPIPNPRWRRRWSCASAHPLTRSRRSLRTPWPRSPGAPPGWTQRSSPAPRRRWHTGPPARPPSSSGWRSPRCSPAAIRPPRRRSGPRPAWCRPSRWWGPWPRSARWPSTFCPHRSATVPCPRRCPVPSGRCRSAPSLCRTVS